MDLHLDPNLGVGLKSPAQIAKALTEGWVARSAYCLSCGREELEQTPANTRALDFRCAECREPYELKASRHAFGSRVLNGEYETLVRALASCENPNLLLLNYDLPSMTVTALKAVPRYALSRLTIVPRKPLGPNARRHGWQGCNIDLTGLPPAAIVSVVVGGIERPLPNVLDEWHRFQFIDKARGPNRQWLPDVLAILRRIRRDEFELRNVYEFEVELRGLHPKNVNIQPKIRQQLQILVAHGMIERVRPGVYRKTARFGHG